MKKVLFVDDELNVLSGLKRMLRPMRTEWDMEFFESGVDALVAIENGGCDVIVSDMRMPIMDGATLLAKVKQGHPESIRIALSGQTDPNMVYRCIKNAHQYLAKPCEAAQLTATVNRACALQDMLASESLKTLVLGMSSLPSMPDAYEKIMEELQSEDSSLHKVGEIIEADIAMSAKILQLVNSAFFGLPRQVASPGEAAMFLGVEVIKNLVLGNGIFSQFDAAVVKSVGLDDIWSRSVRVGALAREIAIDHTGQKLQGDYAMMAGMLCDIGTLVLAAELPEQILQARQIGEEQQRNDWEVEKEIFGYSHMEVGAYLAALWGLPNPIVEAIAYHHIPRECTSQEFEALTAVHLANTIDFAEPSGELTELDVQYIENLGLTEKIDGWRALQSTAEENDRQQANG